MIGGIETSSGIRRRRVTSGEGMLTPRTSFTWGGDLYEAGRTRVAPDHPVTASNFAGLFKPAYAKESGREILRFLERRRVERIDTRHPRRAGHDYLGRSNWRLEPIPGRESWRLG
jgi:hypothetical protein